MDHPRATHAREARSRLNGQTRICRANTASVKGWQPFPQSHARGPGVVAYAQPLSGSGARMQLGLLSLHLAPRALPSSRECRDPLYARTATPRRDLVRRARSHSRPRHHAAVVEALVLSLPPRSSTLLVIAPGCSVYLKDARSADGASVSRSGVGGWLVYVGCSPPSPRSHRGLPALKRRAKRVQGAPAVLVARRRDAALAAVGRAHRRAGAFAGTELRPHLQGSRGSSDGHAPAAAAAAMYQRHSAIRRQRDCVSLAILRRMTTLFQRLQEQPEVSAARSRTRCL